MNKDQLELRIETLEEQLYKKENQFSELLSNNSKVIDQLSNLWEEVGFKNDLIRDQKTRISELKTSRDYFHSRWKRCIADKWEKRADEELEKDKTDKAIFEKALSDERTDN